MTKKPDNEQSRNEKSSKEQEAKDLEKARAVMRSLLSSEEEVNEALSKGIYGSKKE